MALISYFVDCMSGLFSQAMTFPFIQRSCRIFAAQMWMPFIQNSLIGQLWIHFIQDNVKLTARRH